MVGVAGLSDSHIRFRSMGPFRYVWFKLRLHSFSPTDAPNRWFSSQTAQTIKKTHTRWVVLMVGVAGFEPAQA